MPDSTSPNGYALDVGDASPCSESGDKDWYVEARGLVGKDFIGHTWGVSPRDRRGCASFVEWHEWRPRIPHGYLSRSTVRPDGSPARMNPRTSSTSSSSNWASISEGSAPPAAGRLSRGSP